MENKEQRPTCHCGMPPEMECLIDAPTGDVWEHSACGRVVYRSKKTPVETWLLPEATVNAIEQLRALAGIHYERRFCVACGGSQWHIWKGDGPAVCLNCRLKP